MTPAQAILRGMEYQKPLTAQQVYVNCKTMLPPGWSKTAVASRLNLWARSDGVDRLEGKNCFQYVLTSRPNYEGGAAQ